MKIDLNASRLKVGKISNSEKALYRNPSLFHQENGMRFYTVWNNGDEENFEKLIDLKAVFTYCLPKMGSEYIVRHVMDSNHRLICCQMKIEGVWTTLGGICVRPFFFQRFGEVVFLAVKNDFQGQRLGRSIMRVMKQWMKYQGIRYFLTYADNHAIGFFEKLGFTKTISMPKSQYDLYIKHYVGSELMECPIYEQVNYMHISDNLVRQVKFVVKHIEKLRERNKTPSQRYRGLERWKQPLQNILTKPTLDLSQKEQILYMEIFKENGWNFVRDLERLFRKPGGNEEFDAVITDDVHRKIIRELIAEPRSAGNYPEDFSCITGLLQAGYCPPNNAQVLDDKDPLAREVTELLTKLTLHKDAWPFLEPVQESLAPNYFLHIKRPMDLKTMKDNVEAGNYEDFHQFKVDFKQIITNCKDYNGEGNTYWQCAKKLDKYFDTLARARSGV